MELLPGHPVMWYLITQRTSEAYDFPPTPFPLFFLLTKSKQVRLPIWPHHMHLLVPLQMLRSPD